MLLQHYRSPLTKQHTDVEYTTYEISNRSNTTADPMTQKLPFNEPWAEINKYILTFAFVSASVIL